MTRYESAKEIYARYGIDTDDAIAICKKIPVSLHCWQGDDVLGFDHEGGLSGGIQTTGNYPGRARTPDELFADMDKALSLCPGAKKINVHACYAIFEEGEFADRAAEEYISLRSEDPRSIFRPTVYSLVAEVTYFDGETMFVKLTATLSLMHKGLEKRVIDAHAWSLDDQMLLPPRQAVRRLIPTGRLPLMMGDTGFIAENGKYFLCRGGELFPIAEGHRKKHKNPKSKKEQ